MRSNLAPGPDRPYAAWMLREALPAGLAATLSSQAWAWALDRVVTTGRPLDAIAKGLRGDIPDSFIERFARLNAEAVIGRWLAAAPPGLSPGLARALADSLAHAPGDALRVLVEGRLETLAADFVFQALLHLRAIPGAADRRILEPWLKASGRADIASLLPFWAGDDKAWGEALAALPIAEYAFILGALAEWPNPPIPLWKALPHTPKTMLPFRKPAREAPAADPARTQAWLTVAAGSVNPKEWEKVLDALADQGEPALARLADLAPAFSPAARGAILQWLNGYRGAAEALRTALGVSPRRT
jgi:hypothetical protein